MRYDSLYILLAVATEMDLEICQFDVRTAFLYGELTEEIYMKVPSGLNVSGKNMACRLLKALYRLKQASRCWNLKFTLFFKQFQFETCEADKCVYKGLIDGSIVLLALHVDDGLIIAKTVDAINTIINALSKSFDITVEKNKRFCGLGNRTRS